MNNKEDGGVRTPISNSNTLDYQPKPISVKITKKIEGQLDYIAEQTQMTRSNIIRYSISELYRKIKLEAGDDAND